MAGASSLVAGACAVSPAGARRMTVSDIDSDTRIDVFTTGASLDRSAGLWRVPIHARVYRLVPGRVRKRLIAATLKSVFGVVPDREARLQFDDRLGLLISDNLGDRRIVISVAGRTHVLPPTGSDGHVRHTIDVPAPDIAAAGVVSSRLPFRAVLRSRDDRDFSGVALLVPPEGRSIISDIDDTVKITHVTDTARMLAATFTKPFAPVPGMAERYRGWAQDGAAIHYVSSTPWHLHRPLVDFLAAAGFPAATMALKQIRLKDSSIGNILADASVTKPPAIEALLAAYPDRTFVLVGDTGERDPEIYADVMREHRGRIERIFIRNVTGVRPGDDRLQAAFAGLNRSRWRLFDDASELPARLTA